MAFAVMAAAMIALLGIYIHPLRAPKDRCPAPPRRLIARWVPECGIHGYRSLELAVEGAAREWTLQRPLIIARVSLWGRVFPYSDGFRAEWGRIDELFDDGSGMSRSRPLVTESRPRRYLLVLLTQGTGNHLARQPPPWPLPRHCAVGPSVGWPDDRPSRRKDR